jgi:hypothetical protein
VFSLVTTERATGLEPATSSLGRRPVYGRTLDSTTVLDARTSGTLQHKTVDPLQKTDVVDPRWTPLLDTSAVPECSSATYLAVLTSTIDRPLTT